MKAKNSDKHKNRRETKAKRCLWSRWQHIVVWRKNIVISARGGVQKVRGMDCHPPPLFLLSRMLHKLPPLPHPWGLNMPQFYFRLVYKAWVFSPQASPNFPNTTSVYIRYFKVLSRNKTPTLCCAVFSLSVNLFPWYRYYIAQSFYFEPVSVSAPLVLRQMTGIKASPRLSQ